MLRRRWAVLLVLSSASVFSLMYMSYKDKEITDMMSGSVTHPAEELHIKVTIRHERPTEFYKISLEQAHRLLGEKRDFIDRFNYSMLNERKERLSKVCSVLTNNTRATAATYGLAYYKNTNVLYCPVAKVASSFWSRMLHIWEINGNMSPFEIGRTNLHLLRDQTRYMSGQPRKDYENDVMKSAFKFIFSRDPYKRIYSAYIDKFLCPNSGFWRFARHIITYARTSPSNKSMECGHDLRFSELVKFILDDNPKHIDPHFTPVSVTCDVCNVKYDFVGKVETFKHDVMYILNKTHASEKGIKFKDFSQENSIYYIIFYATRTYHVKKDISCVTDHVIHLRLWRMLQISGLIEKYDNYPLTPEESRQANLTTIINLLLDAYHRSTSGARSNSRETFLQAYGQVSLEDMEKLRLKYRNDFILFDYEDRPEELFGEKIPTSEKHTSHFDYFDVLRL